jgi:hypothetical protein
MEDVDYYAVFASLRHTLLAARVTRQIREYDLLPGVELPIGRYASILLARVLAEARPGCARHAGRG